MGDEESGSWIKTNMGFGIIITSLITALGYMFIQVNQLTREVENMHTDFDAYKKAHEHYAAGVITLWQERFDYLNTKINEKSDDIKNLAITRSVDRFTGTEGKALRGLMDERYATTSRRLTEVEADVRMHYQQHRQNRNGYTAE